MPSQYSHLQFFRRVSNEYLVWYFALKKIDLGIEFTDLKENDAQAILAAFLKLPETKQAEFEAEFQDVNALACDAGVIALIDEANFHQDKAFADQIGEIEGLHGKGMWAFLNHPEYWRGATMFLHADNVSASFWKKRNDLLCVELYVDDEDI